MKTNRFTLPGVLMLLVLPLHGAERTLHIEHPLLTFPVSKNAPLHRVLLEVEGKVVRDLDVRLVSERPDLYAQDNVGDLAGREVTLRLLSGRKGRSESKVGSETLLNGIRNEAVPRGDEPLYRERYRPQLAYSAQRGWTKDVNGLVYHEGEYHLFYQYAPFTTTRGPCYWGHAVSRDLVHWRELPPALRPYTMARNQCWSGSTVIDDQNVLGLNTADETAMVAFFTDSGNGQSRAVSLDRGRSFRVLTEPRYVLPFGPVGVSHDPRVFWYEPEQRWAMIIFGHEPPTGPGKQPRNAFLFFSSTDLTQWEQTGSFVMDSYECPDLFPLPVPGRPGDKKWVVYSVVGDYWIGDFDGKTFVPETGPLRLHQSKGNMLNAFQTFNHAPDGRRILMGACGVQLPGMMFNHQMSLPVELSLRPHGDTYRLRVQPVEELKQLRTETLEWRDLSPADANEALAGVSAELVELEIIATLGEESELTISLHGTPVHYETEAQTLWTHKGTAPLTRKKGRITLRIYLDRTTLTVFANDGDLYTVEPARLDPEVRGLSLQAKGAVHVERLRVYPLRGIWPEYAEQTTSEDH